MPTTTINEIAWGLPIGADDIAAALEYAKLMRPRGLRMGYFGPCHPAPEVLNIGLRGVDEVLWSLHRDDEDGQLVLSGTGITSTQHPSMAEALAAVTSVLDTLDASDGLPWEAEIAFLGIAGVGARNSPLEPVGTSLHSL